MWRKFLPIFYLMAIIAVPAHADTSPFDGDLKEALANGILAIENYTLDTEGLKAFYTVRDFKPAWNFTGIDNEMALAAFLDSIDKTIRYHGVENSDYPLDLMRKLGKVDDSASRLKLELLVANTLLYLVRDLHGDDIDLNHLYPGWNFHRQDIDIPAELAKAVASDRVNELLDELRPKNLAYLQLAHVLQEYREIEAKGGWSPIDHGPTLRPQDHGHRVAQLRARLMAENYLPQMDAPASITVLYDSDLKHAVETYQLRNGLDPDGNVGAATFAALNVPLIARIDQIRANMERWRHMPDDYPPARAVIVNIPDVSIDILEDSRTIYRGPVIVGQVERKTPFIQSEIRSMIINPSWHVPAKIARADILPKLREDPHYLEKLGFVIRDSEGDPLNEHIDWKNLPDDEFNFRLRQEPGKQNSLGRLKLDFANDFAVYLHGTPHQELFKKNERALSSGCVRLRDPSLVAQTVLGDTPGDWTVEHIEKEITARKTRWVGLKTPMPIYILYWTVFVDESGQAQFRKDIYDYDRFLMDNLRGVTKIPATESPSESSF